MMTREQAIRKRDRLAAQFSSASGVLRGSLLQRTVRHSSGCLKCARGEGHYREFKQGLEAISELNQFLLRLDREESKEQERES
jgi:hypothetical protein